MIFSYTDLQHYSSHPLQVLDQPASGYILDVVARFTARLAWKINCETVSALLSLAPKFFPTGNQDNKACFPTRALIRRLQVAGHLLEDQQGLVLTAIGEERRSTIFRAALAEPAWVQATAQIEEDLMVFAETEGLPLGKG